MGEPRQTGPRPQVGCTFIMFRGAITGRVVTCGVCAWCRAQEAAHFASPGECPRETCNVPDTACILGFDLDRCPSYKAALSARTEGSDA